MRHVLAWVPILTLVAVAIGYLARKSLAPASEELVIEPPPAARIAPLELPERTHALGGRVVDPAGAAVGAALVWMRAGDEPHWTYTDAEGAFRLEELEAGPWKATVVAIGFAPLVREIEAGSELVELRLAKPFGPPPSMPPIARAGLSGIVTSRLPESFEGCEVVLLPTAPPQTLSAPLVRRADVAEDGTFEIEDLIVGEYRVEVRPEWARGGSWPDLASPEARTFVHEVPVGPEPGPRLAIELAVGDVIGQLVDLDFETIQGALLLLAEAAEPSHVWPTFESGSDGSYFLRGIPAGRYALTARAGSATFVQEIVVRSGETTALGVAPLEVRRAR